MRGDALLAAKKMLIKGDLVKILTGYTGKGVIEKKCDVCLTDP